METAQANLDAVLADPSQEQLAVAQSEIDSAEVASCARITHKAAHS